MTSQFLTLRLTQNDAELVSELQLKTGLSKSEIVRRALNSFADTSGMSTRASLYELGAARFGRHGDATRQAANIKAVVHAQFGRPLTTSHTHTPPDSH